MLKSVRAILVTSAVLLFLGWASPADSRQDQQDKGKGQEKHQEQGKPAKQDQPQANKQQDQHQQQQHQQAKGQPDQQRQTQQQQSQQRDNSAKQQAGGQKQDNSGKQNQQQAKRQQGPQTTRQHEEQDNSAKQQGNHQDDAAKQNQQQAKRQQDQQHQNDNAVRPDQQARGQQNQERQRQGNRSAQQRNPAQVRRQEVAWQGNRAHNWQSEHRDWQQRGGYSGYRVPDDRFRGHYGQDHPFRIYSLPVAYVGGQRRFQYGGYWFGLVDPWPEYWSNNWYDDDDVYVDYSGDGYYLYNRSYPRDRIAISFYVN